MNSKRQKQFIDTYLSYQSFKNRKNYLYDEKLLKFLSQTKKDIIPIYVNYNNFECFSFVIPKKEFDETYIKNTINWNFQPYFSYGLSQKGDKYDISPPMEITRQSLLKNSEPIIYSRRIPGFSPILELNQIVEHILELYENEKGSYKSLDYLGDLKEIVKIENNYHSYCTINEEYLKYYLYVTDSILIRLFYIEFIDENNYEWIGTQNDDYYINKETEIFYRITTYSTTQVNNGYYRGFQIIRADENPKNIINKVNGVKKYIEFDVLNDNNEKISISCNPKKEHEYCQMQPIYFKNEVLVKYHQNLSKYYIENNIIHCRDTWTLRYNLNYENEVYVYLKELKNLPFEEQQYWKLYNILSDNGIRRESIERDFKGLWSSKPTKLEKLKYNLNNFPPITKNQNNIYIWKMSKTLEKERNIYSIRYIETESPQEIENEINFLNKLIIEGFKGKEIQKVVSSSENSQYSIKLLKLLLKQMNIEKEIINKIIYPLQSLKKYRNIIDHSGQKPPLKFKEKINGLIDNISDSIDLLVKIIKEK